MNFIDMIIKEYLADFISLFYPELCISCTSPLPKGVSHICVKCRYDLPKTGNHKMQIDSLCEKFQNIIQINQLLVYCFFHKGSKFQRVIHFLKYQNRPELGEMLGRWYAYQLKEEKVKLNFDLILPVPLHKSKRKRRGYNQSEEIAKGLNSLIGAQLRTDLIERIVANKSLTRLGKIDRIKALKNTYRLNELAFPIIEGKRVLLVDDILTTGSTLIACAETIESAKPKSTSLLVLGAAQ